MSKIILLAVGAVLACGVLAADGPEPVLSSDKDKISYGLGLEIIRNLKKQDTHVDLELLIRGLRDGASGTTALVSEAELRPLMRNLHAEVRRKTVMKLRIEAEQNRKQGVAYLEKHSHEPGVAELPSGVQYKLIKKGSGKLPTDADRVKLSYRATLLDGTEFDSMPENAPALLKLSGLIPGWKEALKKIPIGSRWQIVVPAVMAWGERGNGMEVGPDQTVVFEGETLAVSPDESAAPEPAHGATALSAPPR